MRIAFVWTGFTSYLADCWRALAAMPGVELRIFIEEKRHAGTDFRPDVVMRDLSFVWCYADELGDVKARQIQAAIEDFRPDVLFVVGWHSRICRAIVQDERLKDVPKVCCFDMPWRWQFRCLAAPLVLGQFLRGYRAAFVPGDVCARYARWLGFRRIYKGLFAIDTKRFSPPSPTPLTTNDRPLTTKNYFLYIGRNSPEKRLGDLRAAHALYRAQGGKLDLRLYGKGLEGGFVSPEQVPELMHGAAAFVLASDFDPWPLVLLEAMSAGCPVIASDKCTNRPELGKNWRVFKVGDVRALARAMMVVGAQSLVVRDENIALARQYDCREWVKRVLRIMEEVTKC